MWSYGFLFFLGQVAATFHLVRTGRSLWWLLGIYFLVPFGLLFYFLFEVVGRRGAAGGPSGRVELREVGGKELSLAQLRQQAKDSPTVEHQTQLARRLLNKGEVEEAIALYEGCLTGVYRDDPNLRYELAEAYHAGERAEATLTELRWLREQEYRDYPQRRELLWAIALGRSGEREAALAHFAKILPSQSGEQANYEYARLLIEAGQTEAAQEVIAEMEERWKPRDRRYKQRESDWYRAARRLGTAKKNGNAS